MDDLSLLSKVSRFAKTTKLSSGLAVRLIGENYLNKPIDDEAYAKLLKEGLGNLKGPLMKMAQFLTTIPDTLPDEYYDLMDLQSKAPPMGIPFVKRRMQLELGSNWQQHFKSFNLEASFAASLGQVHKAIGLNDEPLAVKLQYPGMQDITEADLAQLKLLMKGYEFYSKGLETENIYDEIKERLFEELDYLNELKNLKTYRDFFKSNDFIKVPNFYEDLSTKRLLTMEWFEGNSILTFKSHSEEIRNQLGELLFTAWYLPFYQKGFLHADPHPGNYLVLNTDPLVLGLLDFGCIRHFSDIFIQGVKDLYNALDQNDMDLAVFAFEQWGFKNLSKELIAIILEWARLLYDPLLDDSIRLIQKNTSSKQSFELAKKIHQTLKDAGGIAPPREFVFMDRAAVGIGSVLMRLNAHANWHKLFHQFIN
ncbi:MAG: AarF/ABC1/UbiB kinase family protein [Proteobacteria bacterium]|nr:AarF/ABC1/UbiB kinase family protein [Pseudomonadota bacterium]